MKVDSAGPLRSAGAAKRGDKVGKGQGGEFAKYLEGATQTEAAVARAPVGAVDALIALQEVGADGGGRKRARQRAEDMLDRLEEIRIGLLDGHIPRERLEQLVKMCAERSEYPGDPQLAEVMAEIELRARVELAKLEAS
jgi:hypothetical protein